MKTKNIMIFLLIFLFLISSLVVFAGGYNGCRYNLGLYGQGEDCGGGGGGGAASGGGGGGGGGSRSTSTVKDGGEAVITLSTPNDLEGDIAESSFEIACLSETCTISANEVLELPEEVAGVYSTGELLAAVNLECTGQIGKIEGTIKVADNKGCTGVKATFSHSDGTTEDALSNCENGEDLKVETSSTGCTDYGYLLVWRAPLETQPTVSPLETGEGGLTEETVEEQLEVQPAVGTRKTGLLYLLLALIVVVIIGYFLLKKKKRKF